MNDNDFDIADPCPICAEPMRAMVTIDSPQATTRILQCRRCGISTRKTVNRPSGTPMASNAAR